MGKSYKDMTDYQAVTVLQKMISGYWGCPDPVTITPEQRTAIWMAWNFLRKSLSDSGKMEIEE